jgi:hypothetical protein
MWYCFKIQIWRIIQVFIDEYGGLLYGGTAHKYCYRALAGIWSLAPLHHNHNVLLKHEKTHVYSPPSKGDFSLEMKFSGCV